MHFVSERPTEENEGYVQLTGGENSQFEVEGAISGSLTDIMQGGCHSPTTSTTVMSITAPGKQ